jgi:hypothetical protein
MSCFIRAYRCDTPGCKNIISNHLSLHKRFCEECAKERERVCKSYYKMRQRETMKE